MRIDGRNSRDLRSVQITPDFIPHAEGSVLIEVGRTRVICTASVEESVPAFMRGNNKGWITAEYSMLPRATESRTPREASLGRKSGRTQEIQRLIGRSLRTAANMDLLGERTIWVDCDVIEADGGTRTAAITGAFVAMVQAMDKLVDTGVLNTVPIRSNLAAVSVGIIAGVPMLDLNYAEDSSADVDFNVVMTDQREFVELQGTAERQPFSRALLDSLLDLAESGIEQLNRRTAARTGCIAQAVRSLVVASKNRGKAKEIAIVLRSLPDWKVEMLPEGIPDIDETGATFIENAVLKAEYYSRAIDSMCVADDSGLVVDALGGRPGIYSARYASTDDARNQRLLEELKDIPMGRRDARFVCALAVARDGHSNWSVEAHVEDQIAPGLAGEYGFGYDPLFWVPEFEATTGQLLPEIKNQISHRGLALRRLEEYLGALV